MIDHKKLDELSGKDLENYLDEIIVYWEKRLEKVKILIKKIKNPCEHPTITEKCENYNKSKLEFIDNVNLDQCEHEGSPIEFYNKRPVTWKCLKCGECYK